MNAYVVDTHPLYWYFIDSPSLKGRALEAFEEAERGDAMLYVPAIVLVELLAIYEKFKPGRDFQKDINTLLEADQFHLISLEPLDVLDLPALAAVPEMHDRMVAALARHLNIPCITRDRQIVQSGLVTTIW